MKTSEILFASAILSIVAGAGAALATGAFLGTSVPREASAQPRALSAAPTGAASTLDVAHELDELRLENTSLRQKLDALERRMSDSSTARVPLVSEAAPGAGSLGDSPELASLRSGEVTPEFVARVDQAMATLKAREEAERDAKRKEQQAVRIEEKLTELQGKLGLSNRQTSDLRGVLLTQDDKRDALFASMREAEGDPRNMREGFRTIRDETFAQLETILTPQQLEGYKQSEEREWGGRGPGGPGGTPGGGGFGGGTDGSRPQREGR